jgi:hypothetical protein
MTGFERQSRRADALHRGRPLPATGHQQKKNSFAHWLILLPLPGPVMTPVPNEFSQASRRALHAEPLGRLGRATADLICGEARPARQIGLETAVRVQPVGPQSARRMRSAPAGCCRSSRPSKLRLLVVTFQVLRLVADRVGGQIEAATRRPSDRHSWRMRLSIPSTPP